LLGPVQLSPAFCSAARVRTRRGTRKQSEKRTRTAGTGTHRGGLPVVGLWRPVVVVLQLPHTCAPARQPQTGKKRQMSRELAAAAQEGDRLPDLVWPEGHKRRVLHKALDVVTEQGMGLADEVKHRLVAGTLCASLVQAARAGRVRRASSAPAAASQASARDGNVYARAGRTRVCVLRRRPGENTYMRCGYSARTLRTNYEK
jgi:hypothetical protein